MNETCLSFNYRQMFKFEDLANVLFKGTPPSDGKWLRDQVHQTDKIYFFFQISFLISKKLGTDIVTLLQIYSSIGLHLVFVTYNYTKHCLEFLDYRSSPDLELALAILMSTAIPGVLPPVQWKDCMYIDPGHLLNYPIINPIFPLDQTLGVHLGLRDRLSVPTFPMIRQPDEVPVSRQIKDLIFGFGTKLSSNISSQFSILSVVANLAMDEVENLLLFNKSYHEIQIDTGPISALSVNLTDSERLTLIENGLRATCTFDGQARVHVQSCKTRP